MTNGKAKVQREIQASLQRRGPTKISEIIVQTIDGGNVKNKTANMRMGPS